MDYEDKTDILNLRTVDALRGDSRSAWFVVIGGREAGRMYKLDQSEMVIGRGDEVAIRIVDDGISRRHALVKKDGDGNIVLSDLGSTNGTFCEGHQITERVLKDGDKIRIGTTTILKFSFQDDVEEDFQRRQYEWATRDALTGCFNKKYFAERLPSEIAYSKRRGRPLSLAMCDIDFFKRINDTHGHQAGDFVLRTAARVLSDNVRPEDTVARWGGEEFAVIMRDTAGDQAVIAAERIRKRLENFEFLYEEAGRAKQRIPVTISIGIATWGTDPNEASDRLMHRADECLYRAKHNGRNRTECADAVRR